MKLDFLQNSPHRLYFGLLLGILIGTFGVTSLTSPANGVSYGCFVVMIIVFLMSVYRRYDVQDISRFGFSLYDAIPLMLLLIWAYGFFRGLYFGNDNIYRNFAGMTLYSLYYVFLVEKLNKFNLLRCVILAGAINATYMFGFFVWDKVFSPYFYMHDAFTYIDVRAYYSETLMLVAVPALLILHKLFAYDSMPSTVSPLKRGAVVLALPLFLYIFAFVQISLSKAAVAFYVMSILFLAVFFWKNVFRFVQRKQGRVISILAFAVCLCIYPAVVTMSAYAPNLVVTAVAALGAHLPKSLPSIDFLKYLQTTQPQDAGTPQAVRKEGQTVALAFRQAQSEKLIEDMTLLGKGLGATLGEGYGKESSAYGFEANYWNILHKFGIFGVFIFFVYLFIGYKILRGFTKHKVRHFAVASSALAAGIIMGFGNPVLMSPVMVTLQCIALYWLRDKTVNGHNA